MKMMKRVQRVEKKKIRLKRNSGTISSMLPSRPLSNNLLCVLTLWDRIVNSLIKKGNMLLRQSRCSKRCGKREKKLIWKKMSYSKSTHLILTDSTKRISRPKTKEKSRKLLKKLISLRMLTKTIKERMSSQRLKRNL